MKKKEYLLIGLGYTSAACIETVKRVLFDETEDSFIIRFLGTLLGLAVVVAIWPVCLLSNIWNTFIKNKTE